MDTKLGAPYIYIGTEFNFTSRIFSLLKTEIAEESC